MNPPQPASEFKLAMAAWRARRPHDAEKHLREVIRLAPDHPRGYAALSRLYFETGRPGQAAEFITAALRLAPDDAELIIARAYVHEVLGEFDAVARLVRPLIAAGVKSADAAILLSRIASTLKCEREALDYIADVLRGGAPNLSDDETARLHFARATVLGRIGEYDLAFEAARQGNECQRVPYDPNATTRFVDRRIDYFTPARLRDLPRASTHAPATPASRRPVFIVGMPRSGTTLVEQILASHPEVYGAGELTALVDAFKAGTRQEWTQGQTYPDCLDRLTVRVADQMAGDYLAALASLDTAARYVTDKMHSNFLHLGMIALVLPGCHVIHCVRDPLDTCLSCYMSLLVGYPHTQDLTTLGLFYQDYRRLMAHWKSVLDLPILDVKYEDVVHDTRGQARRLLEFLDLPWDDRCLRYYEHRRPVATLSSEQVRRPIYTSAIGRWRHYQKHLGALISALGNAAVAHA
ncbi:MAG TPA: sulfotransferase [Tepidisphaeraceae bacterium]